MLTDIFSQRYADRKLWTSVGESERALLIQGYRMLAEQVMPPHDAGKKDIAEHKARWISLERRISMELGLEELSPHVYATTTSSGSWPMYWVCRTWMLAEPAGDPDKFVKDRLSLIEVGFRDQFEIVSRANEARRLELVGKNPKLVSQDAANFLGALAASHNQKLNDDYNANVAELNERFRRARAPLHFHNGFIQFTSDEKTEQEVVQPFWKLVADKKWENVNIDMAEAVDRRDTGGRDPAFYAAKALESVIKIISDEKGWTRNTEKGVANYIDNLVVDRAGTRFVAVWEKDLLTSFFSKVRNELGHGPGGELMPSLTEEQTNWAIENSMSWCKSLIKRL